MARQAYKSTSTLSTQPSQRSPTLSPALALMLGLVYRRMPAYPSIVASALGVATLHYAPFALFNLLCPVIAIIYGFAGFGLKPAEPKPAVAEGV